MTPLERERERESWGGGSIYSKKLVENRLREPNM